MSNLAAHSRNVKELHTIINSYEKKLDDKVNEMFQYIINHSKNINESQNSNPSSFLPLIHNRTPQTTLHSRANVRRGKSAKDAMNEKRYLSGDIGISVINEQRKGEYMSEADELLKSFKERKSMNVNNRSMLEKIEASHIKNKSLLNHSTLENESSFQPSRAIGTQKYTKPRIIRKKPQVLTKEMRWDPFYEKNAIKAQQLDQGMMQLIERGKIGKNIDIITAFEKGRPILQASQAIFHHVEEKYADTDFQQQLSREGNKKKKPEEEMKIREEIKEPIEKNVKKEQVMQQYQENNMNSWALTLPEDSLLKEMKESKSLKKMVNEEDLLENYYLEFLHYRVVKDEKWKNVQRMYQFNENWGIFMEIVQRIEKILKKYTIEIAFIGSLKVLELVKNHYSLKKITQQEIKNCLSKPRTPISGSNTSIKKDQDDSGMTLSLKTIKNPKQKLVRSTKLLYSFFTMVQLHRKYMQIIKRKKIEKKMGCWLRNVKIIKNYRNELVQFREKTHRKFQLLQKKFKIEYPTLQSCKHFEIHIPNYNFMTNFKFFSEFCTTEITRIFNLENSNTHIIYVCPFELNVDTINYYFKIMELEEIEMYNDRVTFLQLEEVKKEGKSAHFPSSLSASARLYYSSQSLRKLKRKILGNPAYFVTSHPSETDISLAAYLEIPILSGNLAGNLSPSNTYRSSLTSPLFENQSLEPLPALRIAPRQSQNVFNLSNMLIRHCETNKKNRKYIIKINNKSSSAGLALLQYPFSSLPELYSSTTLVQPYHYRSIEKYFSDLVRLGGVVELYLEGIKTITVCGKVLHDESYIVSGTFEKVSSGFINIGYIFPQKCIPHKIIAEKTKPLFEKLVGHGHIGHVEITLLIDIDENIFLEQIQLFSTKITNSLSYFKFLQGGYFNNFGEFMTKITTDDPEGQEIPIDESFITMEPRGYCYIPFTLHFGLSEKQTSSFFQLCRIAGISFDLENKYGTTFILLGAMKDTIGVMTTAKDRKGVLKLLGKALQFLIKQNSYNVNMEMLREKEERMKERYNILSIKERFEELL